MAVKPFSKDELNYFKFSSIVLDEFPKALRQTFISLWDSKVGVLPSCQLWDDSVVVRNMLLKSEGGKTEIPINKSIQDWDSTALFKATIFAKTFRLTNRTGAKKTLAEFYLKGRKQKPSPFHPTVNSPSGDRDETLTLAIDQLRLLRNTFLHAAEPRITKADFDQYVQLAKDAFIAANVPSIASIDAIGCSSEADFPTEKVIELNECVQKEKASNIFLQEKVIDNFSRISKSVKISISDTAERQEAISDQFITPSLGIREAQEITFEKFKKIRSELIHKNEPKTEKLNNDEKCNIPGMGSTHEGHFIKFSVEVETGRQDQEYKCVGHQSQTLKDAMAGIQKHLPTFSTANHLLFAEVKGRNVKVAVPPTLLCGLLKEDTLVEVEKLPKSKESLASPMAGHQTNLPKFDQQTIFFIKTDDRKNKQSITTIPHRDYKGKDLCVIANDGDTFLKALEDDGRFTNPENFQLQNENESTRNFNLHAKHLSNEVFSVLTKGSGNRKVNTERRISPGDKDNTASDGIGSRRVIIKEKTDDDMYQSVVNEVKSMAYESFLDPSEAKNEKTRDKSICDFVKKQFSKTLNQRKPTWLIQRIVSAAELVGRIFCGSITATCFLVREDIVMTNFHVYHGIQKEIQNSGLPDKHKKAAVRFNEKYPNQVTDLVEVEVHIDEVIAQSSDLDYVLLRLKGHKHQPLRARVTFCDRVFKNVAADQTDGLVTIIGHPGGQPKTVDTDCRLVSKYLWCNQVPNRVEKNVGPDSYFYLSQKIKEEITSDGYEHKLTYNTNFSEGSSGSPVINDQGLIIAMHRCGFMVDGMSPNTISVIEFGVSMAAIFNDLYQRKTSLATELFPNYLPPMDISHD